MANVDLIQHNFNGGEWSPLMEGRTDLEKYPNSLYRLENFLIDPRGAAIFRPGWKFIKGTKHNDKQSRLIPFEYSVDYAYMLEVGDYYIRFYRNQAQIQLAYVAWVTGTAYPLGYLATEAGSYYRCLVSHTSGVFAADLAAGYWEATGGATDLAYEIPTSFLAADVISVKYCQSADVLYLWHKDYAPGKLSRAGHTSWSLTTIAFRPPPIAEEGIKPAATLTPGATTGLGVNFTAGAAVFQSGDVGRVISSGAGRASITAFTSANVVVCDILDDFASVAAIASGSWKIEGSPVGTLTPSVKSPVGAICTLTGTGGSEAITNLFRASDVGKYIRIHSGLIKLTEYTSTVAMNGEILKELTAITATTSWTLESEVWNATNGYPSCGTFYEDRLIAAGSPEYPETVWGSVVGDYENHTPGVDDSDAISFVISGREVSVIKWLEPDEYLIVGSAGKISRIGPDDSGEALTPLNVLAKRQSIDGAADIMPVATRNAILYVCRTGFDDTKGLKVAELAWSWESEKYVTPDMTLMAEHVTETGLIGIAYQKEPSSILWGHRYDGLPIGLTYLREQQIMGWHRHPTDGEVESMATIPGDGYNEVWAIIKRTVGGSTVRYVEMMAKQFNDDADTYTANKGLNAFFVDCGITYTGAATATITGLDHLEGESVVGLANGSYVSPRTVTGGQITLPVAATVAHIGKAYTGIIQTMRPEVQTQKGTIQGKVKKVNGGHIRVYQSATFKVGVDESNLDEYFDKERVLIMGAPYPLYTGDIQFTYDERWAKDGRVMIVQDKPMPLTVIAMMQEVSLT